jgi:glyoxylase-like metal-dependent hydrolase (beta-lactamase superfamily II)
LGRWGNKERDRHATKGHTGDGLAVLAPAHGVLACGDYLSDVELPIISPGGSLDAYRATLARFAPLLERVEIAVPGHGSALPRDEALRILDEDVDYLDALERGDERPALPEGRDTGAQRKLHAENLAAVS